MSKRIGYLPAQHGLVLLTEDLEGGSTVAFDIPAGYASIEWHYYNMHPGTNQVDFGVQFNASGGSGFDEYITSTAFYVQHGEGDGAGSSIDYQAAYDQAGGTGYQALNYESGNDGDQSVSGILTLYDPSSTTYVKHFMARTSNAQGDNYFVDWHTAGYVNTTTAIDEISFKFDTEAIQAGVVKMYGLAKS